MKNWKTELIDYLKALHLQPFLIDGSLATSGGQFTDVMIPFAGKVLIFRVHAPFVESEPIIQNDELVNDIKMDYWVARVFEDIPSKLLELEANGYFEEQALASQKNHMLYHQKKGHFIGELTTIHRLIDDVVEMVDGYGIRYERPDLLHMGQTAYRIRVPIFGGQIMSEEIRLENARGYQLQAGCMYLKYGQYVSLRKSLLRDLKDKIDFAIDKMGGIDFVRESIGGKIKEDTK